MMRLAPNELRYLLGRVPRAESGRHLPPNLKRILVTGAAGSIGGGIVEALAARAEVEVLAHDIVEGRWPRGVTSCRGDLLDISDDVDVGEIDAVIHAAALKDVCPLEADPAAAWRTNVEGSLACARLAKERGAELFLQVSTDKAADPAGVMGASKRLAEIRLLREFAGEPMRVVCLRLPNVLGSSGSILPILRDRLAEGRSLPLRDPDSSRCTMLWMLAGTQITTQSWRSPKRRPRGHRQRRPDGSRASCSERSWRATFRRAWTPSPRETAHWG